MAAKTLNFGGGVRNGRAWDDCGGLGMDRAARRAVAAKAAAAVTVSSEVINNTSSSGSGSAMTLQAVARRGVVGMGCLEIRTSSLKT